MSEAVDRGLGAPRLIASWRLPSADAVRVVERLAARVLAATRDADRAGMAWLDSGGPALSAASESVVTGFPVDALRLDAEGGAGGGAADAAARDVEPLLARLTARGASSLTGPDAPRFQGGWIGFLGYEAAAGLEDVPLAARQDLGAPLSSWGLYPTWLRHHPQAGRLELWSRVAEGPAPPGHPSAATWCDWVEDSLSGSPGPLNAALEERVFASRQQAERLVAAAQRSFTRADFEAAVQAVQAAIREGEVLQANIAHRLRVPVIVDPFAVYVQLRRLNPSPFAMYLEEGWGALASNSPERLFAVRKEGEGRIVEARPIAGTRPRGSDAASDAKNALELMHSPKERAEHTMLVDLARNDIGRVALAGSVRVTSFQAVEAYSHVHHLVSRVAGRLRPEVGLVELARALFPGGTVTGAPKLRSIEVIDRVEAVARGPYTGSAGYVNPDGSLDWNILIRTLIFAGGMVNAYAGAGIVADSAPEREYMETLDKAAAMLVALATVQPVERLAPVLGLAAPGGG